MIETSTPYYAPLATLHFHDTRQVVIIGDDVMLQKYRSQPELQFKIIIVEIDIIFSVN